MNVERSGCKGSAALETAAIPDEPILDSSVSADGSKSFVSIYWRHSFFNIIEYSIPCTVTFLEYAMTDVVWYVSSIFDGFCSIAPTPSRRNFNCWIRSSTLSNASWSVLSGSIRKVNWSNWLSLWPISWYFRFARPQVFQKSTIVSRIRAFCMIPLKPELWWYQAVSHGFGKKPWALATPAGGCKASEGNTKHCEKNVFALIHARGRLNTLPRNSIVANVTISLL